MSVDAEKKKPTSATHVSNCDRQYRAIVALREGADNRTAPWPIAVDVGSEAGASRLLEVFRVDPIGVASVIGELMAQLEQQTLA